MVPAVPTPTPTLRCEGLVVTVQGTQGPDVLTGTPGRDANRGGPGNDMLSGNQGADVLRGGIGHDHLYGNRGSALLRGVPGTTGEPQATLCSVDEPPSRATGTARLRGLGRGCGSAAT